MATDEELIAAVASGDGRRLEELCRRWERPLYQLIARHTGGRDVEDLYQETWLRVVRAARRFDPGRRFSTWLFQIATNLCRDWHRRPAPGPPLPGPGPPRPGRPPGRGPPAPGGGGGGGGAGGGRPPGAPPPPRRWGSRGGCSPPPSRSSPATRAGLPGRRSPSRSRPRC